MIQRISRSYLISNIQTTLRSGLAWLFLIMINNIQGTLKPDLTWSVEDQDLIRLDQTSNIKRTSVPIWADLNWSITFKEHQEIASPHFTGNITSLSENKLVVRPGPTSKNNSSRFCTTIIKQRKIKPMLIDNDWKTDAVSMNVFT